MRHVGRILRALGRVIVELMNGHPSTDKYREIAERLERLEQLLEELRTSLDLPPRARSVPRRPTES